MKCKGCTFFNWDFTDDSYDTYPEHSYCGLHGGERVDPDGPQMNLDNRGGCGYWPKMQMTQLELF